MERGLACVPGRVRSNKTKLLKDKYLLRYKTRFNF